MQIKSLSFGSYGISIVSKKCYLLMLCLFNLFLTNSCKEKKQINVLNEPILHQPDSIANNLKSSFSDTVIVSSSSAVFFNPDSVQIQKIKERIPENQFESSMHDCYYQMKNAQAVMKQYWPKIKIIETTTHTILLFVKSNKTTSTIDLNNTGEMCGIFLFDGKKDPELTDMMNIETFLRFYFEK